MNSLALIIIGSFLLTSTACSLGKWGTETSEERTTCAPNMKAVRLEIVKQKTKIQKGEESTVLLLIHALRSVTNVTVAFDFSKGLKTVAATREVKIAKIDSGRVEVIPLPITVLRDELQSVKIEVKGKMRNPFANMDVDFHTGEEVGMLYNEQTKNFEIETSFETMTNAYRVWNLLPEDTLRARGRLIVFKREVFDSNFQQAKPVGPQTKRMKSLNHKAAFTEISFEDSTNTSLKNEKSKTLSTNSVQSRVCVTVTGTLYYENSSGEYVPLPNATVDIWEDDTFSDDYLTSTITNQNGHFSVSLCDDDGIFDSHLEIYAILATINDRVGVLNYTQPGGPNGFNPFWWATWVIETGGGTVDYGNLLIGGDVLNRGGAKIFDNAQRAWSASVARGFNPSYTPIVYPSPTSQCGGSSCYSFQTFPGTSLGAIYLQSGDWLNGNEDIAYHEYGHALMHRAFANVWYPNTGDGNHNQVTQPAGFAWSEGWATFYTQVVNNDSYYNTVQGYFNLEDRSWMNGYPSGDVNEWRVAQAMTDLYDTNVDGDDQGSIAFNKFISTMQSNNSNSLTEFWDQLKNSLTSWEKYYGSRSLIYNSIFVTQDPLPVFAVSISGPTHLTINQTGTYTATPSNGVFPYTYQWYAMEVGSGGTISPLTVSPNRPPVGYWYATGTDSPTLNFADSWDFELKCVVTDAASHSATSNILYVSAGGSANVAAKNVTQSAAIVQEIPNEYSLGQNYPNPFNPSTQILFGLCEPIHVRLIVYDMLGREVARLADEQMEAGYHSVIWNANNVSSGIYIYRLSAGNFVQVKRMLMMK